MTAAEGSAGDGSERLGLVNQLTRFVAIGAVCALVDSGTYAALLTLGWPLWLAKTVAFVLGTTASYLVNRRFTFRGASTGNAGAKAGGFVLVYLVTLLVNVGTNQLVDVVLAEFAVTAQLRHAIGWVVAQGISTLINFVMLKWVVFRES